MDDGCSGENWFREVADQYSGMQWMAMTTSQLSRSGGVARQSKGSGVQYFTLPGLFHVESMKWGVDSMEWGVDSME